VGGVVVLLTDLPRLSVVVQLRKAARLWDKVQAASFPHHLTEGAWRGRARVLCWVLQQSRHSQMAYTQVEAHMLRQQLFLARL